MMVAVITVIATLKATVMAVIVMVVKAMQTQMMRMMIMIVKMKGLHRVQTSTNSKSTGERRKQSVSLFNLLQAALSNRWLLLMEVKYLLYFTGTQAFKRHKVRDKLRALKALASHYHTRLTRDIPGI
jgi:hypothetical protein